MTDDLSPRPARLGPFVIESELGRGGMGIVYRATQEGLNRPVALKILDPHLATDPEFAARFSREAALLASLDSPHVIAIYDYGRTGDYLYLATQYVGGGDLHGHIRRHGALPPARALDVFTQIVSALGDAHARGVIHRDVKPSNILLRADRTEPYIYLCDFGIAQSLADDGHTQAGMVAGSLAYMPPERHLGQPATVQSDLYSAACVLWVMLTGTTPYSGTDFQMAIGHASAPVPVLPGAGRVIDELNNTLAWCMAKDPAARPPDAGQLLAHLAMLRSIITSDAELDDRTVLRPVGRPPATAPIVSSGSIPTAAVPAPPPPPPPPPRPTPPPPPVPPQAPTPPAPVAAMASPAEPRRQTRRIAWLAIAAVAVVALVTTGYLIWPRPVEQAVPPPRERPSPTIVPTSLPPASPTPVDTPAVEPPIAELPTLPPEPSQTPTQNPPPVVTITCWDGSTAASLKKCGTPEGTTGLRYLFPSLEANLAGNTFDCTYVDYPKRKEFTFSYDCPLAGETMQNTSQLIRYRYWTDTKASLKHYRGIYKGQLKQDLYLDGKKVGTVFGNDNPSEYGRYALAFVLLDGHMVLSIEGADQRLLQEMAAHVRFRTPNEFSGFTGDAPTEVTWVWDV